MIRALALIVALAGLLVMVRVLPVLDWAATVTGTLRAQGVLGGVGYLLLYAVLACAFVPGSIMTMLAGATWGLGWGVAIILPAAVLATTIAAVLGRTLLRDATERILERSTVLLALDRAFGQDALRLITLLRLSPVLPFAAANYGLGATSAPIWAIAAGTAVGLIPITVVWTYLGTLVGEAAVHGALPDSPLRTALLVGGLLATVLVVVLLGRLAKAQMARDTATAKDGASEVRP